MNTECKYCRRPASPSWVPFVGPVCDVHRAVLSRPVVMDGAVTAASIVEHADALLDEYRERVRRLCERADAVVENERQREEGGA